LVTRLDLVDPASITAAVAAATEKFGTIDVLLNNAGYGAYGPLEATPLEKLRRQMEVNFFGLVATMQAVLPTMRAAKSGTIINVSSVGGRMCYPLGALYHGSKWAVEGLTEAVSYELLPLGIRVKLVEPGGVKTDFAGRSFDFSNDESLAEYQPMAQAVVAAMENMDTSGHQAPEEVAEVIFTAATDGSSQLR
jgi:NAD(P)-dependent dehydrogenase (short-subunit alcohol dehydrogenase family)